MTLVISHRCCSMPPRTERHLSSLAGSWSTCLNPFPTDVSAQSVVMLKFICPLQASHIMPGLRGYKFLHEVNGGPVMCVAHPTSSSAPSCFLSTHPPSICGPVKYSLKNLLHKFLYHSWLANL